MTSPSFVDQLNAFLRDVAHGRRPRPDHVKLTREQITEFLASAPPPDDRPAWQRNPLDDYAAVPVRYVDAVEESTPYERGWLP